MPKVCYIHKNFRGERLALIEHANRIIGDYQQQGLRLTLRQLYYRFVAADLIPNTERSYKRLGDTINDARLAGMVDWNAIEDRGRNLLSWPFWDDPEDAITNAASRYRIDKWKGQKFRIEVWVEKQALEAVIGRACSQLEVPYLACKGYMSQSEMWRAAQRFHRYDRYHGQRPVIIHLGDHEPSGIDMSRDIDDRLDTFRIPMEVRRIALNMDQVDEYQPPPNPAKMTDSRYGSYRERYGQHSWELDALDPPVLIDLIRETIEEFLDRDAWDASCRLQEHQRQLIEKTAEEWDEITEWLG